MSTTILKDEQINLARMKVLLSGLKLERMGFKRRGRSCYSIVKKEFGLKGSKEKVYRQFLMLLNETQGFNL